MRRKPIFNVYQDTQQIKGDLIKQVNELMEKKKGVLGLDEDVSVFDFFFKLLNLDNDWENRRLLRQFIITAPLQEQFSAALLSEEFIIQGTDEALEFFDILKSKDLSLGVRLDSEMSSMFGSVGEYIGTGVENMAARFLFYRERGCVYSKWRSIYQIKDSSPSLHGSDNIACELAKFAALSQACGLVPIISVEVLPDGSEDIYKARRVLEKLLINLIKAFNESDVLLEATILQVTFVQPGRLNRDPVKPEKIAKQTLEAFKRSLPVALGGIMFHSSCLSEENATQTLNHIILKKQENEPMLPWRMTYSFGRAQKASAIMTWGGDSNFEEAGQGKMMMRAEANNKALLGEYEPRSVQGSFSDQDLFIPDYIHMSSSNK